MSSRICPPSCAASISSGVFGAGLNHAMSLVKRFIVRSLNDAKRLSSAVSPPSRSRAPRHDPSSSRAIAASQRATRQARASPARALRPRGRASGQRRAISVRLFPRDQFRQLERLGDRHPAGSPSRSPPRARGCRVPAPAGRSFEGGPARSTLLLPGAGTAKRV